MLRRIFDWFGFARLIAFGLIAFALTVRVIDPIPLQIVRNLTFDFYQRIQPRMHEDLPVVIIDVDDASISEIGQWPWPRTRFADLVRVATQGGAIAIAFDIIFAEPDRLSPRAIAQDNRDLPAEISGALRGLKDNDDVLAEAMAGARVIVGQTSVRSAFQQTVTNAALPDVAHGIIGPDPTPFITKFPDLVQNLPQLESAASGRGVFSIRPDPDGVYRDTPVVMSVEGQLRLGLAAEMLRVATGGAPFAVRSNEAGIDGVVVARKLIRTASNGTVRPYLTTSRQDRFIPAADILQGRTAPDLFTGKLVFVGTSAVGLGDYRATALGVSVPGVEIHAQLLENLLTDTILRRPNYAIATELVAALSICLLFVGLTPIMNARFLIISSLVFLVTYALVSFLLFQQLRTLIDPSFPILAGLLTIIFMSTTNYMREEKRRREIRSAFRHYVSEDLVNALSENPENLRLGGETRDLTLLFADVRGFTPIAESYRENPEGLTELMNRFLSLLSQAVLDEQGTIDKFMGDAVMAFWNAPLDHADHTRAACRAALQMRDRIDELNKLRAQEQRDGPFQEIRIGIGVATGSCMVGNMGSDMRFDYTAMGDPVNLASRLQGQSSTYGKTIIVGPVTERVAREDFAMLEVDFVRLKGKRQAEHVFALLGGREMRDTPQFAELTAVNTTMLSAYRGRDFDLAERILGIAQPVGLAVDPRLKTYFDLYRERLDEMRETPPPDGWDGVHDARSK